MHRMLFAVGLLAICLLGDHPRVGAAEFRAGAATSNITPPLGDEIIGNWAPIRSTHVHDELHARCLVLDDGNTKLALVVCDSLGMNRLVSEEARRQIAAQAKIPRECVLISGFRIQLWCVITSTRT